MIRQVNYYKIKTTKKLIEIANNHRNKLLTELVDYATDPVIVKRRLRMLSQLSQIESQLLSKIQSFETDDINDFDFQTLFKEISSVTNRNS
jgi:hypothetical protein